MKKEDELLKYKNLQKNFYDFVFLADGGFGSVYSARYRKDHRKFAIKLLTLNAPRIEANKKRFINEIRLMKKIISNNVVRIFGEYVHIDRNDPTNDEIYVAMEYIDGISLKTKILKEHMDCDTIVSIAKDICQGLIDIHAANVVHRDLKPSNVLFDKNGVAKLIDLGISLDGEEAERVTRANTIVGSVQYVAPELVLKSAEPSVQSDIYAFGVMLYEMLADGKLPYAGKDHATIAYLHVNREFPPLPKTNKTIPQALENIVIKCTAKKPEDRYADCTALYNDLSICMRTDLHTVPRLTFDRNKKNKKSLVERINTKKFTIGLIVSFAVLIIVAIVLVILSVKGII